jgi:DNA-binding NtrC family response regulator
MSQDDPTKSPFAPPVIGTSLAFREVIEAAVRVAPRDIKVLITGESGVGKNVLARFIHGHSSRSSEPFVALNCAGITESMLASEMFGHVRGSFTGAYRDKMGSLELAHQGTIFIDEIGDMGPHMQALLLRFLESGELQRVGSDAPRTRVDVRVICATNQDLAEMVEKGAFREDLFYRINVVHLQVPALRERVEDIRPLVQHLSEQSGHSLTFSDETLKQFERYRWPGNVRQLQNLIEQLSSQVTERPVELSDLPPTIVTKPLGHFDVRHERRRSIAGDLYDGLTVGDVRFWEDLHPLFTQRDITRADLRQLIRQGLSTTAGSYRGLLQLFGMEAHDYKRLLNFLAAHDCLVDYREYRPAQTGAAGSGPSTRTQSTPGERHRHRQADSPVDAGFGVPPPAVRNGGPDLSSS